MADRIAKIGGESGIRGNDFANDALATVRGNWLFADDVANEFLDTHQHDYTRRYGINAEATRARTALDIQYNHHARPDIIDAAKAALQRIDAKYASEPA